MKVLCSILIGLHRIKKDTFKTAFEIDQRWIIDLAADRTPHICQSQSLNIFIPADIHKKDLHMLHFTAWKKGVKSLYYCRSKSLQRADKISLKSGSAEPVQLSLNLKPQKKTLPKLLSLNMMNVWRVNNLTRI